MASLLNMSRSSLNRKIKGILDMTPNDYIRLERLKKAAQLLKEGECKINEVRSSTRFYPRFNLAMDRSPGFGSTACN